MFMRVITERIRSWSDVVQGLYPVDSKRSQSGVYLNSAPEEGDDLRILDRNFVENVYVDHHY